MATTISSPASVSNFSSSSVVSNLEDALMKNIGQGIQSGQSADSAGMQTEMQLLTQLFNQSSTGGNTANPTAASTLSTGSGDPSTASSPSSTASSPSDSSSPSSAGSSPSSDGSSGSGSSNSTGSTSNRGVDRTERKLEGDLESNITSRLQDGQSPKSGNALNQEMNLLIELLGQNA